MKNTRIMKLRIAPNTVAEKVPVTPLDRLTVVPSREGGLHCYVKFQGNSGGKKRVFCGTVHTAKGTTLPRGSFPAVALTAGNGSEIPIRSISP